MLGFAGKPGAILEGPNQRRKASAGCRPGISFREFCSPRTSGIGGVPVLYALHTKAVYDLTPLYRIWLVNVAGIYEIRLGLTVYLYRPLRRGLSPSTSATTAGAVPRASAATHLRSRRSATWTARGQGQPAAEDLVSQAAAARSAPRSRHRLQSCVYFRLAKAMTVKHDAHRGCAAVRHGAGRRQAPQGVGHRLHGGIALRHDMPYSPVAALTVLRHAVPVDQTRVPGRPRSRWPRA